MRNSFYSSKNIKRYKSISIRTPPFYGMRKMPSISQYYEKVSKGVEKVDVSNTF